MKLDHCLTASILIEVICMAECSNESRELLYGGHGGADVADLMHGKSGNKECNHTLNHEQNLEQNHTYNHGARDLLYGGHGGANPELLFAHGDGVDSEGKRNRTRDHKQDHNNTAFRNGYGMRNRTYDHQHDHNDTAFRNCDGERNRTHEHQLDHNNTSFLAEKCENAGIVCDNVAEEELADCGSNSYRFHGGNRALRKSYDNKEDTRTLNEFFDGLDLEANTIADTSIPIEETKKRQLRGRKKRHQGGNISGLDKTEIDDLKMKGLVCKCCDV